MNKKFIAIILVVVLSFGILVIKRLNDKKERELALRNMKPPVTPVSLVKPKLEKVSDFFTASGTIISSEKLEIIPKVSGKIISLNVKEGDIINKGQLIAQIESIDINNQILQAEAQVEANKANMDLLINGPLKEQIKQSESSLKQANLNLEQIKIKMEFAQKELERYTNLYKNQVVTKQQLENAQNQVDVLKENFNLLKEQIIYAKEGFNLTKTGNREEQIRMAKANYKQSVAYLKALRDQLNYYSITSPITGIVIKKNIEQGMLVSPPNPIVSISKNNTLEAEINIPERYIQKVKIGQKVKIKIDNISDIYLKITEISPIIDSVNHIFKVKASIENPDQKIKQGMSFECQVIFDEKNDVLMLPTNAVIDNSENQKIIYLIGKDNKVVERVVKTGFKNTEKTEIISGLNSNESVILEGNSFIKEGDIVQVEKF